MPGQPIAEVLPERLAADRHRAAVRASRWTGARGFRFARPVRWICAKLDDRDDRGRARGRAERRPLVRSPADASRPRRDPSAPTYLDALRAAGVEPDRARRYERICAGARRARPLAGPARQARRGRLPRRVGARAGRVVRRAVPAPARARDRHDDAVASALLPARRQPLRVRRERRRSRRRSRGERVRAARAARGRGVHVRTRRRGRDRGARERARARSRSSRARARSPTRRSGSSSSSASSAATSVAVEAARLAKADQASELVREFPELEGHIGATYAQLAATRTRSRARSTSSTCPTAPAARCPRPSAGALLAAADKLDTPRDRLRPRASARPAHATRTALRRAAIGLCRLAIEGGVRDPARACCRRRARLRRGAAGGPARRAGRVRPRGARVRGDRPRRRRTASRALARGRAHGRSSTPCYDGVRPRAPARGEARRRRRRVDERAVRARRRARALRRTARGARSSRGISTTRCAARRARAASSRASSTTCW